MEANELRIGNFITRLDIGDNSRRIEQITELRKDKVFTSGPIEVICQYEEISPILLTEEWLQNFGFNYFQNITSKEGYNININNAFLTVYDEEVTFLGQSIDHIKYVHQLQNLFFALKGNELTLNHETTRS